MPVTRATGPTRPTRTTGVRFAIAAAAAAGVTLAAGVTACGSGDDVRTDAAPTTAAAAPGGGVPGLAQGQRARGTSRHRGPRGL